MYEIDIYKTDAGKEPYIDWISSLDVYTSTRIEARIARIRSTGNLGDYKPLKDGIYKLRFDFGPGYRIYFGLEKFKNQLIILLMGGSKRSQSKDIEKAKKYWQRHLACQK